MLRAIAFSGALLACSSPSGDDADGDGEVGELLGTFQIQLVAPTESPGYTSLLGKIHDGAELDTVIWSSVASDGACTLLTPSVPFCTTPCGSSAACVADDTCRAYPTSQDVGSVRVRGVQTESGGRDFALVSVANSYQPPAGTALAYPAFAEGDVLEVEASGSAFTDGFTLRTTGIAQLEVSNVDALALSTGNPLDLAWSAAGDDLSTITLKLDISHHGGSKGKIECATDDAGSLTIGASLVDQLLALGVAGFPTVIITRQTVGHAAVAAGHADLIASSQIEAPIAVPGVMSCTSDDECTPPATCQTDLTCN